MSATKRKSSRSPEGSNHQKKALRNDSLPTGNDSRKNSSANASVIDASADPRQNRGALRNVVRSPVSTDGSVYQDSASSKSTPLPVSLKTRSAAPISQDEGNAFDVDDAAIKPLLGSIGTLLALAGADSRVQVAHKLAKSQLESATAELQNMEYAFQRFPQIGERLIKSKSAADQEIVKLDRQLKINVDAQPGIAKSLATAFLQVSSRAEKARRVPEIAAVSRDEFKELQEQFAKQQVLLEQQQNQFAKQQDLVEKQQQCVESLQKSHAEASKASLQANASTRSDIDHMRKEMQSQLVNAVQVADRARLAVERHGTAVTRITDKLDVQSKVISQLSSTIDAATNTVSGVQKSLVKLEDRAAITKHEISNVEAKVFHNIDNRQRTVVERLEGYEQKHNDLRNLVESLRSENTSIEKVYEDLVLDFQKVKDSPKPATIAAPQSTSELAALDVKDAFVAQARERFTAIEDAMDQLKDGADARDALLGDALDTQEADLALIKDQLASLSQKVEGLEKLVSTCSSGIQRLEKTSDEKHEQSAAHVRDTLKTIEETYEVLQTTTKSLSESVAALEKRPTSSAPMPAPAAALAFSSTAQDTQQFRPIARQSPHAPNSRPGSVSGTAQTNGIRSPRNATSPFGLPNNIGGPLPREITVLTDQVRGLSGHLDNLKRRMDNLTTDEVVRGMVDQMSQMYPEAKNFQVVAGALQRANASLESRLDKVSLEGNVRASKVEGEVASLRKDIEATISEAKKTFDTAVEAQTAAIVDVKHQVQALADAAWPTDE